MNIQIFNLNELDKRVLGLDILRSFAIFFVLLGHSRYILSKDSSVRYVIENYLMIDGVSIFFVLSGYLIGSILIKMVGKYQLNMPLIINFWQRRWLRTLPNYLFYLILLLIVNYSSLGLGSHTILSYFIFSQNLVTPHPSFFPEAWSLSVEEWFYLSLPVGILLLSKFKILQNKRLVIFYATILIFVVLCYRFYTMHTLAYEAVVFR